MFSFGNDNNKNNNDFWGFGGYKRDKEIEDLWGLAERNGKSFWDLLSDVFFH